MSTPPQSSHGEVRSRIGATDHPRVVAAVRELLDALGEDVERAGLARTPERVAHLFEDMFSGVGADPALALGAGLPGEDAQTGEIVGMRAIPFRSVCEHHLLPFDGTADVFFRPNGRLAGLSRIVDLVEVASRRPQLQERLGDDIADAIMRGLSPHGVVVKLTATHGCVAHLVPHARASAAITIARRGEFPLSLIGMLADDSE